VANQAWNLANFVLHQIRTTRDTGNELHQQQQVALRNSANHVHAFKLMLRLAFGWGLSKRRLNKMVAFEGTIFLMAFTLLGSAGWAAAQLFLATVWTNAEDHFLAVPRRCGLVPKFTRVMTTEAQAYLDFVNDGLNRVNTYLRQCYRGRNTSDSDRTRCATFPIPRLDWAGSDADCPFGNKDLCIATNSTPFRMDSGYINSQTHLSVNADHSAPIGFRYTATCSPLVPGRKVKKDGTLFYYCRGNEDIEEKCSDKRVTWVHNTTRQRN
jgi:hypothetical protein